MKKTLVLILTLITVLSLVTGCGKKDDAPASAVTDLLENLKTSDADELKDFLLSSYKEDSEEFAMFNSFDLTLLYKNLDYEIVSSTIDNPNSNNRTGKVKVKVSNTDFSLLMSEWADETIMALANIPEDTSLEDFNTFLYKKSGEILAELLSRADNKTASTVFVVEVAENRSGVWEITSGLDPNNVLIGLNEFSDALKMS